MKLHHVQQRGREIAGLVRPGTVAEALAAMADGGRPVAGGTDLLLDLQRGGPGDAVTLVDLTAIDGFATVEPRAGGGVRLGGGATHAQVLTHPDTPVMLAQACAEVGSPQLRNRATVAGNLATASPANDTISALMALGATVELTALDGTRNVPVADLFDGFRSTVIGATELITAVDVPDVDGVWVKLGNRTAQAISVVHAGVVRDGDTLRVALGSVAPTVVRREVPFGPDAPEEIAASVEPIDDVRATAAYRRTMVATLIERAMAALDAPRRRPPTVTLAAAPTGSVRRFADPARLLLDALRDEGLTGTKEGCAEGECGACTVVVDGRAVMSCLVLAGQVVDLPVATIEDLDHPLQQAFVDEFAVQCGFCIPGFLMAGSQLLAERPDATDEDVAVGLSGNLCRCTGYYPFFEAVDACR